MNTNTTPSVTRKSRSKAPDPLGALLNSPQFSISSYLNLALADIHNNDNEGDGTMAVATDEELDEVQRRLAELALKLQLSTQSCHDEIGRIGAELQAILPRCSADIQRLSVGLEGMRQDAASVEKDSFTSQDTSLGLETLSTLHSLRLNLSLTKRILSATSSWDSTVSSVPKLLTEQKLIEAVQALTELERGERALRGMPGREDRCEVLQKYRTQMESMLKPQLLHALSNMDSRIGLLQQCVTMYSQLNKMEVMQEEYVKFRPEKIHKRWFAFQSVSSVGGTTDLQPPVPFDVWLREWLDDVLHLLSEEHTRSGNVFGKEYITSVTAKVLEECFRPILPSFQSRLTNLYSLKEQNYHQGAASLQSICSAYQCTLSFLSEAYNHLLPTSIDQQNTIIQIFVTIASPFASYQCDFSKLEMRFSSSSLVQITKNIQLVSTISQITTTSLQDALEKLSATSVYIFEVLTHSINRYSLLQAGYRPSDISDTVDYLLMTHISELTIAISSLSSCSSIDQEQSLQHEQYISTVLEVLKIAGTFSKHFNDFETFTIDTFSRLLERMSTWMEMEKCCMLQLDNRVTPSDVDNPIILDSLSELDARDLLAKNFLLGLKEIPEDALSKLQNAIDCDAATTTHIFPKAEAQLTKLAHSSHMFLFDVMSSLPFYHLQGMSSLSTWRAGISTMNPDEQLDLPQPYITHVGEHMLSLVQALEPFAQDDEALGMVRTIMGGIKYRVSTTYWRDFLDVLLQDDPSLHNSIFSSTDGEKKLHNIMDGITNDKSNDNDNKTEDEDEEEEPHVQFCNEWLDVIATAITGKLMERICRIGRLTSKGANHLSADLNYLINVLMALGIHGHPHPLLVHLAQMEYNDDDVTKEEEEQDDISRITGIMKARIRKIKV